MWSAVAASPAAVPAAPAVLREAGRRAFSRMMLRRRGWGREGIGKPPKRRVSEPWLESEGSAWQLTRRLAARRCFNWIGTSDREDSRRY